MVKLSASSVPSMTAFRIFAYVLAELRMDRCGAVSEALDVNSRHLRKQ